MKKIIVVAVCVGSLLLSACAYQSVSQNDQHYTDKKRLSLAQAHLLLGQWALTKSQLDHVETKGREYWRLLSLYWLSVGDETKALAVHHQALLLYPKDDFLLNNLGVILGQKQQWSKACDVFQKASLMGLSSRQSVWINLSRCAIRQDDVKKAAKDLKRAKEVADLPLIGLMTELNLVLIQGNLSRARLILNNIQAETNNARNTAYFDEYNCLSQQVIARETDPTIYSSASTSTCLDRSRY
ncbi:MAG: tetratricopeptide repeat protein [Marinomonas sp.]